MLRRLKTLLLSASCGMALMVGSGPAMSAQAPKTAQAPKKKAEAAPPPSAQEIADAKAKGLVWVNLSTGVYHKEGQFFGKTKNGKFMSEEDAKKAGYRAAKEGAVKKGASKKDTKK
ncbi:MAG: hypothetical protein IT167_04235 [Bryobacterales bacterium]|nr:hypothetical protein [Bryobacterales bacterium]